MQDVMHEASRAMTLARQGKVIQAHAAADRANALAQAYNGGFHSLTSKAVAQHTLRSIDYILSQRRVRG